MADLPGTNAIEYYLKGRAIREQREQRIAAQQIQQQRIEEQEKLRQQNFKIFETRMQQTIANQNDQAEHRRRTDELALKDFKIKFAKAYQAGEVTVDAEGNIALTPKGEAAATTTENKVNEQLALIPGKAEEAASVAYAKVPVEKDLRVFADNLARNARKEQNLFIAEQNQKNRENTLAAARIRNLAVLNNRNAAKEDKDRNLQEIADGYGDEVYRGYTVLEDLPKGDAGLRIAAKLRENGSILTRERSDNLKQLRPLNTLLDQVISINAQLQSGNPLSQLVQGKLRAELRQVRADLENYARANKGQKGVMTDKDRENMVASIPEILPASVLSLDPREWEQNKITNAKRVKTMQKLYHDGFKYALGEGFDPVQREAIRKEYGVLPEPKWIPQEHDLDPIKPPTKK